MDELRTRPNLVRTDTIPSRLADPVDHTAQCWHGARVVDAFAEDIVCQDCHRRLFRLNDPCLLEPDPHALHLVEQLVRRWYEYQKRASLWCMSRQAS